MRIKKGEKEKHRLKLLLNDKYTFYSISNTKIDPNTIIMFLFTSSGIKGSPPWKNQQMLKITEKCQH